MKTAFHKNKLIRFAKTLKSFMKHLTIILQNVIILDEFFRFEISSLILLINKLMFYNQIVSKKFEVIT